MLFLKDFDAGSMNNGVHISSVNLFNLGTDNFYAIDEDNTVNKAIPIKEP